MRFATYNRKSVYSDRSDSVDNQRRMCRDYVDAKFSGEVEDFAVYQDEGFTGANTDRPGLEHLLKDVKAGLVDALVVYQLDRLSRNVRDFSNIYALLEEKRVMFISIKESIDTSTPIGKAMMYVTMVFAQMERETIAARVTDNLTGLVKKGFWCMGTVPTGYKRKHIVVGGKRHSTLEIDPIGAAYIRGIFADFLSARYSVRALSTAYRNQGKVSLNGRRLSETTLYHHLTCPYYVAAAPEVYDYFEARGCQIDPDSPREKWDGMRAVIVYGRRHNKGHASTPPSEWIVCLGMHEPIIQSDQWLAAQGKLAANLQDKTPKYEDVPLLKGVLRCARCGGIMRVRRKKLESGRFHVSYSCLKRERTGGCTVRSAKCSVVDTRALDLFEQIEADPSVIASYRPGSSPKSSPDAIRALSSGIEAQEAKLGRLAASLAEAEGSAAQRYIVSEIERQDLVLQAMRRELTLARSEEREAREESEALAEKASRIGDLMRQFESFTPAEKNEIVKSVVTEATWDGESLFIKL